MVGAFQGRAGMGGAFQGRAGQQGNLRNSEQ